MWMFAEWKFWLVMVLYYLPLGIVWLAMRQQDKDSK